MSRAIMATPDSVTALLEQTSWVQKLARRLVQDPSMADDLAQDTLVRALEERPDAQRSLRGWLATVMRTSLGKRRRGEGNRTARERQRSRDEAEPSTLDVVERAATHSDVVQAVLGLEEPYRSTILLRFFDQLSYAEIARRQRISEATVNSRITRGLERLRQRLSTAYGGDRHALFLALAPLAKLPAIPAATIPLAGVKLMHLALGAATLSVVAVTVSLGLKEPNDPLRQVVPLNAAVPTLAEPAVSLVEPGTAEAPVARAERAPVAEPELEGGVAQQTRDADRWKTTLRTVEPLAATIDKLAVNTRSGDVRVVATNGANVDIMAEVTADRSKVDAAKLTQLIEDHLEITSDKTSMRIETAHKNESGWSVSITVGVPRGLDIAANSGSGDVHVLSGSNDVMANTGSGDVTVHLPAESLSKLMANSGSGDVEVDVMAVIGEVTANTGSGDVSVQLHDPLSTGKVMVNSGSGDGTLIVPPGVVGSFEIETHSGDLTVPPALGLMVEKRGSTRRAEGAIGSGGGKYGLSTGSGDLEVRLEP
jgi:RNA polymerase sigma-70 factor (ECF subfamily)